ncbi:MAG: oxygen-independent coproporphyrinogen III oxidase [Pseudomonadota bacterium]
MATTDPSPRQLSPDLLARYEKSGPRYTSYPTAPHFREDFDREAAATRWRAGGASLSMYVHIPFCKSRCGYCGCYTLTDQPEGTVDGYLQGVLDQADEIATLVDPARPVRQLSFGGGTPTYPGPARFRALMEGLTSRFAFDPDGERAVEVDPRSVDADYLDLLVDLGFNRFSFGVQDLEPGVQEIVNRVLPVERLKGLMDHLRSRGVDAINLDLIYGLPTQTEESFGRTLERIIALRPTRLAVFGYAHVPWVAPHQASLAAHSIPDRDARLALFSLAWEMLRDAGWEQVGMDHFARPGDELVGALRTRTLNRNFMGYTTRRGLDLVALGASAISAVSGTYTQNIKPVPGFLGARGVGRWARGWLLDDEDRLRGDVIIDLLCNLHLSYDRVEAAHRIRFDEHFALELGALAAMEADGLVVLGDRTLDVTPVGRYFIRNVAMIFDSYLREGAAPGARYSKTI